MSISILAIGKKHEDWVERGIERYSKRLQKPWDTKWRLLPHSSFDGEQARQEESRRILADLSPSDYVVLLDERGEMVGSSQLATEVEDRIDHSQNIVFVIGGAYGVDQTLLDRANFCWSLSPLVFPHQLVRLILIEQLYRAQQINKNHPYHHQ